MWLCIRASRLLIKNVCACVRVCVRVYVQVPVACVTKPLQLFLLCGHTVPE